MRTKKEQQDDFLQAFEETGNVTEACIKANVPRKTHYNSWMKQEAYYKRFLASSKVALGLLEDEANRRAVRGVKRDVYYKGQVVGQISEYSDTLLIVLLKALSPEKYKDRVASEVSGPNGKPIETSNTTVVKTTLNL